MSKSVGLAIQEKLVIPKSVCNPEINFRNIFYNIHEFIVQYTFTCEVQVNFCSIADFVFPSQGNSFIHLDFFNTLRFE